jgi:hypothetical protein
VSAHDSDPADPQGEQRGGCNIFLIALLLLLVAGLAYWGYEAWESGAPNPTATALPPTPAPR